VTVAAPFPWFGGKSRAAAQVWAALGDVDNYVEPFAGSLAVLLARPGYEGRRAEVVNDLDGLIANFWRSMALDPEAVVRAADWPVVQVDLYARWRHLEVRKPGLVDRLRADPRWCDPEAAGWWVWGQSASVGANWLHGYDARPQSPLNGKSLGVHSASGLDRLRDVAARLRHVSVWCADWSSCVTEGALAGARQVGMFLDPPYGDTRAEGCYREESTTVYRAVTEWAASAPSAWRIVIAGYEGEHDALEALGWSARRWVPAKSGMAARADGRGKANRARERLWCSPACLPEEQPSLFGGRP
jgi:DNA adenine methylase